jgi:IS30 family transposase
LLKIALLPNRNNDLLNKAIYDLLKNHIVKSITTDNDIGFSKWKELEILLGTSVYFCHPYHSWEKGLVENCNRWIREFIPKKTDLKSISFEYITHIENYGIIPKKVA